MSRRFPFITVATITALLNQHGCDRNTIATEIEKIGREHGSRVNSRGNVNHRLMNPNTGIFPPNNSRPTSYPVASSYYEWVGNDVSQPVQNFNPNRMPLSLANTPKTLGIRQPSIASQSSFPPYQYGTPLANYPADWPLPTQMNREVNQPVSSGNYQSPSNGSRSPYHNVNTQSSTNGVPQSLLQPITINTNQVPTDEQMFNYLYLNKRPNPRTPQTEEYVYQQKERLENLGRKFLMVNNELADSKRLLVLVQDLEHQRNVDPDFPHIEDINQVTNSLESLRRVQSNVVPDSQNAVHRRDVTSGDNLRWLDHHMLRHSQTWPYEFQLQPPVPDLSQQRIFISPPIPPHQSEPSPSALNTSAPTRQPQTDVHGSVRFPGPFHQFPSTRNAPARVVPGVNNNAMVFQQMPSLSNPNNKELPFSQSIRSPYHIPQHVGDNTIYSPYLLQHGNDTGSKQSPAKNVDFNPLRQQIFSNPGSHNLSSQQFLSPTSSASILRGHTRQRSDGQIQWLADTSPNKTPNLSPSTMAGFSTAMMKGPPKSCKSCSSLNAFASKNCIVCNFPL